MQQRSQTVFPVPRAAFLLLWHSTSVLWVSWRPSNLSHTRQKWPKCSKVDWGFMWNADLMCNYLDLNINTHFLPRKLERRDKYLSYFPDWMSVMLLIVICVGFKETQQSLYAVVWRWRLWRICFRERVSSHTAGRRSSSSSSNRNTTDSFHMDMATLRLARSPCSYRWGAEMCLCGYPGAFLITSWSCLEQP